MFYGAWRKHVGYQKGRDSALEDNDHLAYPFIIAKENDIWMAFNAFNNSFIAQGTDSKTLLEKVKEAKPGFNAYVGLPENNYEKIKK